MYKILASLFLIIITSFACKKLNYDADPNEVESNGQYVQDTLYAIADSVISLSEVNTSLSDKISLGQRDGLKAGFLIHFVLIDTLTQIDSVYLQFTTVNSYGAELVDNISTNIYSVDSAWGLSANQYSRFRNPPIEKMEFITQGTLKTKDSAISNITIPLDFNNIWNADDDLVTDSLIFNLYFELGDGNENAIVELGSYRSNQSPLLIYRKISERISLIDTIGANASISIFNYDDINGTALNHPDETVIVSSGILNHSLFKFNFDDLPKDAIYYRAILELTEDDLNEYENTYNNSSLYSISVESLADTTYNSNTFLLVSDEGFSKTSSAYASLFGEEFVQPIINNSLKNEWIEIRLSVEDEDFSVKRYWSVESPDKTLHPKLIVNYLKANK